MKKKQHSKFYNAWNSHRGQKIIAAIYSIGAAVVILGAMFKIIHLPFANIILGVGMTTEALIFALGIFDKPHKSYEWDNVFDFITEDNPRVNSDKYLSGVTASVAMPSGGSGLNYNSALPEEETERLKKSIKKLSETAEKLQSISEVAVAANGLTKNIQIASNTTLGFAKTQKQLSDTTTNLSKSFNGIADQMGKIINATTDYQTKIGETNKHLSSINSVYEIQLQQIQKQSESITQQTICLNEVTGQIEDISQSIVEMKDTTKKVVAENNKVKGSTENLAKKVESLNAIYGNMLNAFN